MRVLGKLDPEKVFYYFEEISNIPRGSGNEKAISDYMVNFAKEQGLWVKQDEVLNIYIKKPASPGYEDVPAVIIQGHMDMVCEKNNETVHDFETEGLNLYIDGDFIRAKGTTLGADNGVAIAYQLAVLADKHLEHPAIEVLMTTAEETGMDGVSGMHPEYLEGKMLINLDTDNEGEFLVSCAGGAKAHIQLPVSRIEQPQHTCVLEITVDGLVGGHSGADIHFERANANILMNRLLDAIRQETKMWLVDIDGGSKDNVITREAVATICIPEASKACVEGIVSQFEGEFKAEYEAQDKDVAVKCCMVRNNTDVVTTEATDNIIDLVMALPHGIMAQSRQIEGLVETSLNIGVVQLEADALKVVIALRSSVATKKQYLKRKLYTVCKALGAQCDITGDYPAWEYASVSPLRDKAIDVFQNMYGKEPKIEAIHAGLECGFLLEKLPGLDMIAFGPNVYDIHSPKERLSISSMARMYDYLTTLLKEMKNL